MKITVDVDTSGPLFDGRALRALREFVDDAPYEIAREGIDIYLSVYRPQVQHPTPYYEYLITRERVEFAESRIWDGGEVPYGPWLESTGSKNYPVTRFRGYHSMEKSTPLVQAAAAPVAEALLRRRYLSRMQ